MVLKTSAFFMEAPGHIEGEFGPSMPLHDPSTPWLAATYPDGSTRLVDLKTALLEAHLIDKFELGHTVITHSVYRLLLTIAYSALYEADELPDRAAEFSAWQRSALATNAGFPSAAIETYFDKYADRFYLVHPRLPFLQDPSLYRYVAEKSLDLATADEIRKAFTAAEKDSRQKGFTVSQTHPLVASYKTTAKCHQWGLAPEIFSPSLSVAERTSAMFGTLVYQRTSLGPIGRGERTFSNDGPLSGKDTHSTISPLRRVVHYLPKTGSLFRDLVIAMKHAESEQLAAPAEWEREVAPTGWLAGTGVDGGDRSVWLTAVKLDAPREAMNDSQMAILFAPLRDGDFTVLRKNRYRNSAFKAQAETSKKAQEARKKQEADWRVARAEAFKADPAASFAPLPSAHILPDHLPPAWNPYIARRVETANRPLVAQENLSEDTALSHADIMRVPLLGGRNAFQSPPWFSVFDSSVRDVIENADFRVEVRVLVNGGKLHQDVDFNDFELTLPSDGLVADEAVRDVIRGWMVVGDQTIRVVSDQIKSSASLKHLDVDALKNAAARLFWAQYTELFRAAVLGAGKPSKAVGYTKEIVALALDCFDSATEVVRFQNPLQRVQFRSKISPATRKAVNENGS